MSYVVLARYRTLPDVREQVLSLLDEMSAASRAEPGCRGYRVHRGLEDEQTVVLYEEYDTEADFTAHCESEHFQRIVRGSVIPLLEQREVVRLAPREVAR